ncbi:hypothetical protein J3R82DRAFT_10027 [Butyriboletus roseoflavus]|nr:hypothetical protein J3R82DRAFT_10027 [Butyriboletus roseoflavus]
MGDTANATSIRSLRNTTLFTAPAVVVVAVVQLDFLPIVGHVDQQSKRYLYRQKSQRECADRDILAVRVRHRNTISVRGSPAPPQALFTFLATILILVLLSASLVLRSYILRRRYRQRFQQALADGLFVDLDRSTFNGEGPFDPLGELRRSTRRPGPKPALWDNWIHPAEKDNTWSSITPVALWRTSSQSPSKLISSAILTTPPPDSPSLLQAQPRSSLLSQLRLQSPFSLSSPRSSSLPRQAHTPIESPTVASPRLPAAQPGPSGPSAHTEKDAAILVVCVLVAMPDASAPVNLPVPGAKGKGVDPLESQAQQQSGDADPLLQSSLHRSGLRIPDFAVDEEGLPLLEFGVVEVRTGE